MLKSLLLSLRQQPKDVRNGIAFAVAGVSTGVIALVWLVTLPGELATTSATQNPAAGAFSTFFKSAKEQVTNSDLHRPPTTPPVAADPAPAPAPAPADIVPIESVPTTSPRRIVQIATTSSQNLPTATSGATSTPQ